MITEMKLKLNRHVFLYVTMSRIDTGLDVFIWKYVLMAAQCFTIAGYK